VRWDDPISEPEFARFAEWASRYRSANAAERISSEQEGVLLARERREALRGLIPSDPARALALAVPEGVRRSLPESVTRLLEERISGRGSLDVFGALAKPGKENEIAPTFQVATIDGRSYKAFVYGRRLGVPTRQNIPLNGVAVDNLFAVNENPLRLLDPEEAANRLPVASDAVCAISGNPSTINQTPVAAEAGGVTYVLCGPSHALRLNEQLIDAEVAGASGGGGGEVAASPATEGNKKLILIRVDFSDAPGEPVSDSTCISLISGLNDFYRESSFGRSGFVLYGSGSTNTPTFRMPQTAAWYGANDAYVQLRTDARNAATAGGYTLGNYNYDLICFTTVPSWGWAGLGYVGAPGVWLQGYFTAGVAGHELGHNYGLNHANFWDTGGQSVIGGNGSSIEYGDNFDTMGSASAGANHFNARYKSYLNWLQAGETTNVTVSGAYRIYPHDDTNSTGLRGLKIVRSSTTNYWVEFRQKFTGNRWLMSGAGIRWAGNGNEKSHLLDTTPGSPDGKNDAALVLGRTFSDAASGIHITTLRKGGTTPESLDMMVNLGTFPGNATPSVSIDPSSTSTSPGSPLTFSATASDPDGDILAYYWDFGDATFGTNGAAQSKSWSSSGEYVVRCEVSDMKGKVASDSIVVTVGSPGTYQISGLVTAGGAPMQGVRVAVSSAKVAYTDSDGTYTLAGLTPGSYTVGASKENYSFSAFGFSNPVSMGPSRTGIDFSGSGGSGGSGGTVTLTSPANTTTYTAPVNVFLSATATGGSGQIVTKVEFYEGITKLGEDASSPYSYSWNSAPAGSYTLTARSTDTGGNMTTSAPVAITINPAAPAITTQPQNHSVVAGGSVAFSVSVSGSAPFSYQWRYNGTDIVGATSPTLALNNVQPQQAGGYSVVISNVVGTVTSATANLTVTCSYALSASSAAFGAAGGSGSVDVSTAGGCSWSVANVPAWITITSGNGGTGNGTTGYSVAANTNASGRNATLIIGGRAYPVSQSAPDLTRPTVAFSSPAANVTLTNSVVTITGTADDNDAVADVDYRMGAGAFTAVAGTDNWSASVTLQPGTNLLSVRSIDVSGNISLTNTRSVFCSVPSSLTLAINGQGLVSGATNGQQLPIGRVCRLTAVPTTGFAFSNWTGDVSGTAPELSFMMGSNLQVTANFVTNPFVACKGSFNGLFYETNQVRLGSSGGFTLALTDKGTYTASLRIGSQKSMASGKLNLEGKATNVIVRPGTNSLTVTWALSLGGSEQITGTVSDGNWIAELAGDRAVFCKTNPASFAGKYTFVVLGSPGSTLAPEGDSYGTASVDSNGVVKVKGYLADKNSFAAKVPIARSGQWPLYASLYSGKGALLGWVAFTNQAATDFEGVLSWNKPVLSAAIYYPGGFSSEAALLGSRYAAPVGPTNRVLNLGNSVVILSGGNLSQAFTNGVILGLSSKVTNASPHKLNVTFTLSSGLFSGTFTPTNETKSVSFKGAVLQKANYGAGHFLGTNLSGRVSFEAGP
jgi:Bacterial Ig domain/PKD domain/Divergent InlB B-repeat domain/Carboxypeptidase regulatory-like domain/Immunoglobulin domain/Glucodextranase, domain B